MSSQIKFFGITHPGLIRQHNEDFWSRFSETLFVLADGMGGHRAGEVAAQMAVELICEEMEPILISPHALHMSLDDCSDELVQAIGRANAKIFEQSRAYEDLKGMGTTLCCLLVRPEGVIYAHIGDSRIYRLRENQLSLLTKDHSLLREMLDKGQIEEDRAGEFLYKNIVTKAVGTDPIVRPSIAIEKYHPQDIYMLCSDGLTDLLSKEEMESILGSDRPIEEKCTELVDAANENGGTDNITVVLVQL